MNQSLVTERLQRLIHAVMAGCLGVMALLCN